MTRRGPSGCFVYLCFDVCVFVCSVCEAASIVIGGGNNLDGGIDAACWVDNDAVFFEDIGNFALCEACLLA